MTAFARGAEIAREIMLQTALRKRFGSPRNMLRSIGMDERTTNELLSSPSMESEMPLHPRRPGDTRPIRSLRARDGDLDAESAIEELHQIVENLPPEHHEDFLDELDTIVDRGDLTGWLGEDRHRAEDRRRRRAEDRRGSPGSYRSVGGRLGRDTTEPFPGRPNPGGELDPRYTDNTVDRWSQAEDRRRGRRYAADSAGTGVKSFEELFPDTRKIGTSFTTGRTVPVL
jgi:hypothetical protein